MKPITADGYWYDNEGKYLVNMTDIYTTLIQYVGRFCESYASDLLYDIEAVNKLLGVREDDSVTDFCLGIRAMGVDGISYIRSQMEDSRVGLDYYYRAMFVLRVTRKGNKATAELKRVNSYEMERYLKGNPPTEDEHNREEIDQEH